MLTVYFSRIDTNHYNTLPYVYVTFFLDASDVAHKQRMSHSSLSDMTTAAERDTEVVTSLHSTSSSSLQRSASVPTRSAFRNSNRSRICVRPRPQTQQRNSGSSQRHQSVGTPSTAMEQSREAGKTGGETLSTSSLTASDNKAQPPLAAPPTSPTHHAASNFMRQLSDMYTLSALVDDHSVDGTRFSVELVEKLPFELLEAIKDGTLSGDTYALILRRQKELRQGHLPLLESGMGEYNNNDLMWWHGMCVCIFVLCVCVRVRVRA